MIEKQTQLQYISNLPLYDREKPYNLSYGTYAYLITTNVEKDERTVLVRDVRDREAQFSYESHSFRFLKLPAKTELNGSEQNTIDYLEETRAFLLQEFQADRVICYDIRASLFPDLEVAIDASDATHRGAIQCHQVKPTNSRKIILVLFSYQRLLCTRSTLVR